MAYTMWGVLGLLILTLGILVGVMSTRDTEAETDPETLAGNSKADTENDVQELKNQLDKLKREKDAREKAEADAAKRLAEATAKKEAKRKADEEAERKAEEEAKKEAKRKAERAKQREADRREKERLKQEREEAERLAREAEAERRAAAEAKRREAERKLKIWTKAEVYLLAQLIDDLPDSKEKQNVKRLAYKAMDKKTTETKGPRYFVMAKAAEACLNAYNELLPKDERKTLRLLKPKKLRDQARGK